MKKTLIVSGMAMLAALAGCSSQRHSPAEKQAVMDQAAADKYFVTSMADTAVKNGIISQHTLYPYHFTSDAAQLNELGVKELGILGEHFKVNGGHLTLRQGGAPDDLYKARLEVVNTELKRVGVADGRVVISDGFGGGAGMSSERVNAALKEEARSQQQTSSNSSSTSAQPTQINPSQP